MSAQGNLETNTSVVVCGRVNSPLELGPTELMAGAERRADGDYGRSLLDILALAQLCSTAELLAVSSDDGGAFVVPVRSVVLDERASLVIQTLDGTAVINLEVAGWTSVEARPIQVKSIRAISFDEFLSRR
jgi:hypothetical protein